jgi:heterotetrameric sarcosine oxidase gamma subunit
MCSTIPKESASVVNAKQRVSALCGIAVPTPAAPGHGIILSECHPLIMLNLRGSPSAAFCEQVLQTYGCELPVEPDSSSTCEAGEMLKLGPDEWLLVAEPGSRWLENMAIAGATLTDVSHARTVVRAAGRKSREMLAKGCPVDLHPLRFPDGKCIQTSIAKINVIVHKLPAANDFALYVARSYAASFWHWLTAACAEYGYHVVERQINN